MFYRSGVAVAGGGLGDTVTHPAVSYTRDFLTIRCFREAPRRNRM